MTGRTRTIRRALTLLELMLALSITAMVGAAISGMLHAVTTGVTTRSDSRSLMIRANASQLRLSAYITPARCLLSADNSSLVLWLDDARQSGTVHATEVRWIMFNAPAGTLDLKYVKFPDSWTQTAQDMEDQEVTRDADFWALLSQYDAAGQIATIPLVDGLASVDISTDQAQAINSRRATFDLQFVADEEPWAMEVATAIRAVEVPVH